MSLLTRLKAAAQTFFAHPGSTSYMYGLPRTRYPYARDVGDGLGSSVLMGVVQWGMRAFPEAPLVVRKQTKTEPEVIPHALTDRLLNPNDAYSPELLWMGTYLSWATTGNAYWRIVHTNRNVPAQLWWIPPWAIEPKWPIRPETAQDASTYISHYRYTPGTGPGEDLSLDEVVHFRHGLNPRNPRLGLSPIYPALREIWGDDEASNWVASLLRNSAVTSTLISPDPAAGEGATIPDGMLEAIKQYLKDNFTGDGRGDPLTIQGPVKVQRLGFDMREMDLSVVRDTAEERCCVMLGIPASVVGFGTGLKQTRVGATMKEERQLAWWNGIIPVQRIMAGTIQRTLLPQFPGNTTGLQVGHDYRQVEALQEDANHKFTRATQGVQAGWLKVAQAKRLVGLEPEPGDDVYLRSFAMVEVGPEARPLPRALPLNGNGNDPEKGRKGFKDGPRVDNPPQVLLSLMAQLERQAAAHEEAFTGTLGTAFRQLGTMAAEAARTVLAPKSAADDAMDAARILEGMDILAARQLFQRAYERHYSTVATSTFSAIGEALGLETDIPDLVMRSIVATGGTRAGLLDLETHTREALFEAITEGRAAGEGVDTLVRRIREQIPAGPWRDAQTRARVVSRTETKYAQNLSTVERARQVDHVEHVMVFDARLGPTDAECEALNGQIVSLEEARALVDQEHPNGSRSLAPVPALLLEEMGVTP